MRNCSAARGPTRTRTSTSRSRPDADGSTDSRARARGYIGGVPDTRVDPHLGTVVHVVASRQDRPNLPSSGCPFCPGGLEAPDHYDVWAFPNRWPALGEGRCEVVLYTPEHDATFHSIGAEGARRVIDLWAERTEALSREEDVACARPDLRLPPRAREDLAAFRGPVGAGEGTRRTVRHQGRCGHRLCAARERVPRVAPRGPHVAHARSHLPRRSGP
ncbi:MAG: hypothetical protein EBT79_01440 [Actinobacteria bacterium]|nr:hypothetical protein [Actinomycetota bacterium]